MLIDLHTHTAPRSPCSILRPTDLVRKARALGLDGICLTEHDDVWPIGDVERLARGHGLVLLRGMEVATNVGHVLVYGLDGYISGIWDLTRLKREVDAVDGAMVLAHPMRQQLKGITHEELPNLFDAIEVFNGSDGEWGSTPVERLATRLNLNGTGGSDCHSLREVGLCATEFDTEIKNERDLIAALKGNAYHPKWLH